MAMRHRPIQPKNVKYKPPKSKRRGAGQHHVYLSQEQQEVLEKFQKDFTAAYPKIVEAQAVAQKIFQELIDQPEWRIAETQLPDGVQRPDLKPWSVGHAKVIDHRNEDEK